MIGFVVTMLVFMVAGSVASWTCGQHLLQIIAFGSCSAAEFGTALFIVLLIQVIMGLMGKYCGMRNEFIVLQVLLGPLGGAIFTLVYWLVKRCQC